MPTTYSEGKEIRTEAPIESVEVVQLPNRDAAAVKTASATPAVKAAVKQRKSRTAKGAKSKAKTR